MYRNTVACDVAVLPGTALKKLSIPSFPKLVPLLSVLQFQFLDFSPALLSGIAIASLCAHPHAYPLHSPE